MSLNSAGVSISLVDVGNVDETGLIKLGYGFDKVDPAIALRAAIEEFIASPQFKELTTTSCYASKDVRIDFLVHTTMPR